MNRDEEDKMYKKYAYNYVVLKSMYPNVSNLDEYEVRELIDILRNKGEGIEGAIPYIDDYMSKIDSNKKYCVQKSNIKDQTVGLS